MIKLLELGRMIHYLNLYFQQKVGRHRHIGDLLMTSRLIRFGNGLVIWLLETGRIAIYPKAFPSEMVGNSYDRHIV